MLRKKKFLKRKKNEKKRTGTGERRRGAYGTYRENALRVNGAINWTVLKFIPRLSVLAIFPPTLYRVSFSTPPPNPRLSKTTASARTGLFFALPPSLLIFFFCFFTPPCVKVLNVFATTTAAATTTSRWSPGQPAAVFRPFSTNGRFH